MTKNKITRRNYNQPSRFIPLLPTESVLHVKVLKIVLVSNESFA
jgi:hypothetical protein